MGYLSISSLILFHSFHCIVSSRDPGVELIVTQNLADYINQNLPSILIPRLSSLSIPDLRNGDAELYSVHVEALNIGSSSIQFSSSGLTLCFSQMSFHGKARWKYEIGIIKFSGKVDIHLKDSNIVSTLVLAEKDRHILWRASTWTLYNSASPFLRSGIDKLDNLGIKMEGRFWLI